MKSDLGSNWTTLFTVFQLIVVFNHNTCITDNRPTQTRRDTIGVTISAVA